MFTCYFFSIDSFMLPEWLMSLKLILWQELVMALRIINTESVFASLSSNAWPTIFSRTGVIWHFFFPCFAFYQNDFHFSINLKPKLISFKLINLGLPNSNIIRFFPCLPCCCPIKDLRVGFWGISNI